MLHLDEIRAQLQDRVAHVVADKTGLHRNTVTRVKSGAQLEVSTATLRKLSEYLEAKNAD